MPHSRAHPEIDSCKCVVACCLDFFLTLGLNVLD